MRLRLGRPRGVLMIAPHPDDETIGAWGLMTRLHRRGAIVRVLVMTDGAASHPDSRSWPRVRLVRERQRETRRAMRAIGIDAGAVTFLGLPDGASAGTIVRASLRVARAVASSPKPLLLIAPVADDDHADHRTAAAAVGAAGGAGIRRLGYRVWPTGAPPRRARALVLTAQQRLAKRRAIAGYRTQTGRIIDDPSGFALSPVQIATFSSAREMFVEGRR